MPIPSNRISASRSNANIPRAASPAAPTSAFASSILLEKAEQILRPTDQFAQWQALRQRTPKNLTEIAKLVIRRDEILQKLTQSKSTNWQEFDQLTDALAQSGIRLSKSQQVQPPFPASAVDTPTSKPPAVQQTAATASKKINNSEELIREDNILILSAVCKEIGLKHDIVGYGDGERTALPLGEIARALDFDIQVHPEQGTAKGWFIEENRTLTINKEKKLIEIDGKRYPWDASQIFVGEDDIYIDDTLLSQWFPIDISVSTGEMKASLTPRELLPIQAYYEREQKRKGLTQKPDTSIQYPLQEPPFELFSVPTFDIATTGGLEKNNQGQAELRHNYSIVSEGDLGYMEARAYIAGDKDTPINNARITLQRQDADANLLGPMHATKVTLGDVTPSNLSLLNNTGSARGITLSNAPNQRSSDFDTTRFEGSMQPGWDVELYQNGNLINSVRVGINGQYLFSEVPVYFGANAFEVVALGPQGQRRIIDAQDITVGSSMLKKGKLEYNLSATQQGKTIPGLDQNAIYTDEGMHLTAKMAYGLTDRMSVNAGFSSIQWDDSWYNYLQAGLSGTLSSVYGEVNTIQNFDGGTGVALQAQAGLGPFNLRAKQEYYADFALPGNESNPLLSRSSLGVNGLIPKLGIIPNISYTLSQNTSHFATSDNEQTSLRLASRIGRVNLSNTTHWNDYSGATASDAPIDGEFQASGSVGKLRLTTGLEYELGGEEDKINRYKLSGLWPITDKVSASGTLIHNMDIIEGSSAGLSLSFDTGKFMVTPQVSWNSEGDYTALLSLGFSLNQDPINQEWQIQSQKQSGKGAATALVYHDKNNNKVFDQDDTPLPEVRVMARQMHLKAETDTNGLATLANLTAHTPTDIEIEKKTLQDPFLEPSIPGVAVSTRSGTVQRVELPVVLTGEIDGTMYHLNPEGNREPLADAELGLYDSKDNLVTTTRSDYDGFYLFQKIFPGSYTLKVQTGSPEGNENLKHYNKEIVIGNDGTIVQGQDIVLGAENTPTSQTIPQERPIPEQTSTPFVPAVQPIPTGILSQGSAGARIAEPPTHIATPRSPLARNARASSMTLNPLQTVSGPLQSFSTEVAKGGDSSSTQQPPASQPADRQKEAPPTEKSSRLNLSPMEIVLGRSLATAAASGQPRTLAAIEQSSSSLQSAPQPMTGFTVHLASYKTIAQAETGRDILAKRLQHIISPENLIIKEIDLGKKKGIFYRVTYGNFTSKSEAETLAERMQPETEYATSIPWWDELEVPGSPAPANMPKNKSTRYNSAAIAAKYASMQL